MSHTIFALATAPGRGALAVVRLSGPGARQVLATLGCSPPPPRQASVRRLRDPVSRETLDEALVVFMPGPKSFTGEDVIELHLHGGAAVVAGVLEAIAEAGARLAGPGEFTRRAFEHGRMDLIAAEAIADLIDADSASQRRLALDQLTGSTSRTVDGWRAELLGALALLEAAIDFPDEDLPAGLVDRVHAPMRKLLDALVSASVDLRGERLRTGFHVSITGAPNAGKSSVLNGLLGRDVAIVADIAGTTRDVIEQPLGLAGYRVVLADMAGIRDTDEPIEVEGVRRARVYAAAAALRLWIVDAAATEGAWREGVDLLRPGDILVLNKSDLPRGPDAAAALAMARTLELEAVECSALEDGGLVRLRSLLEGRVVNALGTGPAPAATRVRHRRLLSDAAAHLERALTKSEADPELMSEDIRLAARALEALTGAISTEAVLDAVFSSFCIGK